MVTNPVFATLILPGFSHDFHIDIPGELIHDFANSHVKFVFGICNVSPLREGSAFGRR